MRRIAQGVSTSILTFLLIIFPFGAWMTHVAYCIEYRDWVFLLAGALMAPIGVVHGVGIWFGIW